MVTEIARSKILYGLRCIIAALLRVSATTAFFTIRKGS